jgi:carbon storage regulator
MLVLTRKSMESIVIPELGVTVKILSIGDQRVRLGIEAPRTINIQRSELVNPVPRQGEDRGAAQSPLAPAAAH